MAKIRRDGTFLQRAWRIREEQEATAARIAALKAQVIAELDSQGIKAGGYIATTATAKTFFFRIKTIGVYHDSEKWTFKLDTHRCFGVTPDGDLKLGAFVQFTAYAQWTVASREELPTVTLPRLVRNAGEPIKPAFRLVKDDDQRPEE